MPTIEELGKRVKAKYAGQYDDMPDAEVGRRVKAKYPGAYDDFTDAPTSPSTADAITSGIGNFTQGLIGDTITGIAQAGKRILAGPQTTGERAAVAVAGPLGLLAKDVAGAHVETGRKAVAAAKQGDAGSALGYGLATALPVLGPAAAAAGETIGEGEYARGAGQAVALLAGVKPKATAKAIGKGAQTVKDTATAAVPHTAPIPAMTKALRPAARATNWPQTLNRAMPELKAAEAKLGRPISSIDDLMEATKIAKRELRSQYEAMGGPLAGAKIDGSPIADNMVRSISRKVLLEEPEKAARIVDQANVYRRMFTVDELDDLLHTTNAELESYYNKYPTAKRSAAAANPETAMLSAQADGMRKTLYEFLDSDGQGAAPREVNRRYGALREIEEQAMRRKNVAERQAPESLSEQLSKWEASGQIVRGGARVLTGDIGGGVADMAGAVAKRKAATWIKEQQTTNALIKSAFERYKGKPVPVPQPVRRQPAGLLGPGPIVTPPPADSSGLQMVTPQRGVARDPRSGRMFRYYKGE